MAKGDNLYLSFHHAISSQALKNHSHTDSSARDAADSRGTISSCRLPAGSASPEGLCGFILLFETQPNSCPLAGESAPLPGFGGGVSG